MINDSADPAFEAQRFPWAYGAVTSSIFLAGFGLVALGHFVRGGRVAHSEQRVLWPPDAAGGRMPGMRIFHIATLADWKQAQETGSYTTSTYGRTLRQEGFVHAAYHDQVPGVRDERFGEVSEPLVVLEIETDLLDAEVREAQVGGETFPHVHGPIPTSAVVAWRPARPPAFGPPTPREPASPLTTAFRGAGAVLSAAALVLFVAAAVAQGRSDDGRLSDDLAFLLWALTLTAVASALAAFAVSVLADRRS